MKRALVLAACTSFATALLIASCSGGTDTASSSSPSGGQPSSAATSAGGASANASGAGGLSSTSSGLGGDLFDSGACSPGQACGDGGVCAGGVCCDAALACGKSCCAAGQICSFQACETPGAVCSDSTDCAPDSYCDLSLGAAADMDAGMGGGSCMGGVSQPTGKCLKKPPECAPGMDPGDPITCLAQCEYKPPASDFSVVLKQAWGGVAPGTPNDVMMAPIVINLDDDNCDGKVNEKDIPEIVFSTFAGGAYYKQGTLHAISVVGGKVVDKWSLPNVVQPGAGLAAADLDGDGVPEIVGCANPGPAGNACCDALAENTGVVAFRADGKPFWTQSDITKVHCGYEAPAIGDVDGDGVPEVLVGLTLLDGKTGAVKKELDPATGGGARLSGLADVDGDGKLDVVDGQRAYRADGTVIWDLRTGPDAIPSGYHAIGDFDKDGKPEVVVISSAGPHTLELVSYDAASPSHAKIIRKGIDINNGTLTATYCNTNKEYGGGPPTVADFDGDGVPDIGAAGAVGYVVFSGAKLMDPNTPNNQTALWIKTTHDCSSAVTGSSVFDFNGDGKAEVIYSDEYHLWMYDGPTGTDLIPSTCNTTGTLWEYPLVADVDNDGQADIVVASNAYGITCPDDNSKQSGIRIFGSASGSWVRTRRIWNEHTYHISNVAENGAIPASEPPNWTQPGLDDYRQNRQPGSEFAAPDAIVSIAPICNGPYGLVATVRNIGEASLPGGVVVGFYEGMPPSGTKLGQGTTKQTLYPAEAENVELLLPNAPAEIVNGSKPVYAVVDDGMPPHVWHECRTDNDTSDAKSAKCQGPN